MTAPNLEQESPETAHVSFLEFVTFLVRHRWTIAGCALLLSLLVVGALSIRSRTYSAGASFAPQSADRMSALAGLAAQFGVTSGGPDVTDSPAFYADLLRTRGILSTILIGRYTYPTDSGVITTRLIDVMKIREKSEGRRLTKAITKLNKLLQVELKTRTGVVGFQVPLENPALAQQVVQRFLDEVARFNLEKRRSKAGAERRFTEARISEIRRELREAEDRLQWFLQRNRAYANSPDLKFEYDRMTQEVDFRRTVYTTVSQSNERARMDEVRDTPVITVIDAPNLPARPDPTGRVKFGLISAVFGGFAGIGIGFLRDLLRRQREIGDPQLQELSEVLVSARGDLHRALRRPPPGAAS